MAQILLNSSKKTPLSGAKKHTDFEVTLCLHFDTTNTGFAYVESEIIPIIHKNFNIFRSFFTSIGLSRRMKEIYKSYEPLKNQPIACIIKTDFVIIEPDKHTSKSLYLEREE